MTAPADTIKLTAFLRRQASSCVAPDGRRGMVLSLGDTGERFPDGVTAQWLGPQAAEFFDHHQAELVKGRCLHVEIYYIRSFNAEVRARIHNCQLAALPPSWVKHADKQAQSA